MRLDSVRGLKKFLPLHLERAFASRRTAKAHASLAVATAASRSRGVPGYFLGVSAKSPNSYRLAVRLQDRALERSSLVDEITARAKGEVDVRYVGRVHARATVTARSVWYQTKQRPLLMGCSVGYLASTARRPARWGASCAGQLADALHALEQSRARRREPLQERRADRSTRAARRGQAGHGRRRQADGVREAGHVGGEPGRLRDRRGEQGRAGQSANAQGHWGTRGRALGRSRHRRHRPQGGAHDRRAARPSHRRRARRRERRIRHRRNIVRQPGGDRRLRRAVLQRCGRQRFADRRPAADGSGAAVRGRRPRRPATARA